MYQWRQAAGMTAVAAVHSGLDVQHSWPSSEYIRRKERRLSIAASRICDLSGSTQQLVATGTHGVHNIIEERGAVEVAMFE